MDSVLATQAKGLGELEGLALGYLVHAQHDGMIGWVEIQTHGVAPLLDPSWIAKLFPIALQQP